LTARRIFSVGITGFLGKWVNGVRTPYQETGLEGWWEADTHSAGGLEVRHFLSRRSATVRRESFKNKDSRHGQSHVFRTATETLKFIFQTNKNGMRFLTGLAVVQHSKPISRLNICRIQFGQRQAHWHLASEL
jgi:hypothetical protein